MYDYDITAEASRTSGVAPLYVHFNADITGDASDFHNDDYTWNFGDSSSGTWGTTDKSKNTAKGAIAAHVFETAGTYNVTLSIKDAGGVVGTNSFTIVVSDPNTVYSGTNTTCVSDATSNDFAGAPSDARCIATDDLSTITQYAVAGSRILFRRGSSWTTSGLTWPNNAGPVTIGAYGTGTNADASGIYDNAPVITVTGGSFLPLDRKQDWRIMDVSLADSTQAYGSIGGDIAMQKILILRVKATGFRVTLGWGHWNDPAGTLQSDQMAVVSSNVSGGGDNVMYVGSERLALLGNTIQDAYASHVLRVWQAYKSVISNNIISGSSINSSTGRLALKLHGPSETQITSTSWDHLNYRTELAIISDNIIGASRPYSISIAAQDNGKDERLANIIFERNEYHQDYGTPSTTSVALDTVLYVQASYLTFRNNVIDGTGDGKYFTGIHLSTAGIAPDPANVWIYNNTIYKSGLATYSEWKGFLLDTGVSSVVIKNNLVSFPGTTTQMVTYGLASAYEASNNLLSDSPGFVDATNATPLSRDFSLASTSAAVNAGADVPVYEDFNGNMRSSGSYDIGAYER